MGVHGQASLRSHPLALSSRSSRPLSRPPQQAARPPAVPSLSDQPSAPRMSATVPPYTLESALPSPRWRMFVWEKNGVVRVVKNGTMPDAVHRSLREGEYSTTAGSETFAFWKPRLRLLAGLVYITYLKTRETETRDRRLPGLCGFRPIRLIPTWRSPAARPSSAEIDRNPRPARPARRGADCIPADAGSHPHAG